ncbi:hypothetical protein LGR54_13900 [Ancylobacter sp. Lp-2]|uniref:hypothetical protein n=1 Tax=Ancylobacter sp. Lp-2 TaxID=2881339 RepID=UPI001E364E0F|nr:hypothetical protein [Ancylobacter sp. Lp-2]MCB4769706.1 hypothetical protein [Ancylobacter sp. Lp-2]
MTDAAPESPGDAETTRPPDDASPPARRRRWGRLYALGLLVIVFLALAPLLSALLAGLIANLAGCRLDEGSVHPCIIAGRDVGEPLYTMGVLGWLSLATLPAGGILLLAWAAIGLLHLGWRSLQAAHRPR